MDINKLYVHAVYMRLVYVHRIAIHGNISFYRKKCNKTLSNQIDEKRGNIKKVICLYSVLNLAFLKEMKTEDPNMFCALARLYGETIPIT